MHAAARCNHLTRPGVLDASPLRGGGEPDRHIIAGAIGIVSGFVALFALKGGRLHRKSGTIFVYAMLILSASGAVIAALRAQRINFVAACLTLYLVTTALLTVRRRDQGFHWMDPVATLVALTVSVLGFKFALDATKSPTGTLDGLPPAPAFMFAAVGLIAALGDGRLMAARRARRGAADTSLGAPRADRRAPARRP